jgi:hypothetical protein
VNRIDRAVLAYRLAEIEVATNALDELCEKLSDDFTSKSDRWQYSRPGLLARQRISHIEDGRDLLEKAMDCIAKAVEDKL